MKRKILLSVLLCLALVSPAWADSKSATIRVSCSIPTVIELSRSAGRPLEFKSNLDTQSLTTVDLREREGRKIRLYSLTAL